MVVLCLWLLQSETYLSMCEDGLHLQDFVLLNLSQNYSSRLIWFKIAQWKYSYNEKVKGKEKKIYEFT